MSNLRRMRIIGLSDEANSQGTVFLNGSLVPLHTPIDMCDTTIENIRSLKDYKTIDYARMTEYAILQMLTDQDPHSGHTLDDAKDMKKQAMEGNPDIRLSPLQWKQEYDVVPA
jgi:hypothetical protein